MELKPCPVCGKQPKIKYYGLNYAEAQCKPLFGKAHLTVYTGYYMPTKLVKAVFEEWNEEVDSYGT